MNADADDRSSATHVAGSDEDLLCPTIVLVEPDADRHGQVLPVLEARYGADYEVVAATTSDEALSRCDEIRAAGGRLALVIAALERESLDALGLFFEVQARCPEARCCGAADLEEAGNPALLQAYTQGSFDDIVAYPRGARDETFHEVITELLADHDRQHAPGPELVQVIGDPSDPRSHEVRDLATRNMVPFGFYPVDSDEGQRLLAGADLDDTRLPVILLPDGRVLADPSNLETARALGAGMPLEVRSFDVTIIGAGPAGLAAAVAASSEGLRTLVVERAALGGQAGTTSMIRNYLGFPRGVSGRDLAQRACQQARRFDTHIHLPVEAERIVSADGGYLVELSDEAEVSSRAVVVAAGVDYRRLDAPGAERLTGAGVFYGAAVSEAPRQQDEQVYVVGGGNSAGQAAVHLARYAAQVTMLVRSESLAKSMSHYLVRELDRRDNIDVRLRTEVAACEGERRLKRVILRDRDTGGTEDHPAAGLFVLIGGRPRADWLPPGVTRDEGGYVLTGQEVPTTSGHRPRWAFETSLPGVFAVGDIRHGATKRIASAAGEGAVCVSSIHQHLHSDASSPPHKTAPNQPQAQADPTPTSSPFPTAQLDPG